MEELVLGMLKLGPAHGYELRSRVREELGPAWRVASSQLYAWLHRLEGQGLVQSSSAEAPGRPPRTVYALTPAGEERFRAWLRADPATARRPRGVFLVRLYFLARFAPEHLAAFVAHEAAALERRRKRLLARKTGGDPFREAVRRLRLAQVDGGLRWLGELDALFNTKEEGCAHEE
jgi:DNA-binding PadR family transcriptional regulator